MRPCKECGKEVSSKADKCPHCGVAISHGTSIGTWIGTIFIIYVLYSIGTCSSRIAAVDNTSQLAATKPAEQLSSCNISKIEIVKYKAHYERLCNGDDCIKMKGTLTLKNNCDEAVGVQLKIIGFDKNNSPVAAHELWPASVRNINPGEETFSMDFWLDYDPSIKSFSVEPIDIRKRRNHN